jgi:hypothetical protein
MDTKGKDSLPVLRDIATTLGDPISNVGLPYIASLVVVGLVSKQFKDDLNALLTLGLFVGGALLVTPMIMHYFVPFNGKRILIAIEKDYGPRTRQRVYETFAHASEGEKIVLDIPELARSFGESQ